MRECGVLLPISSLPSKYGIGCFSKEAYEFVDFLRDAGQKRWQILPMGPTGYGDSPYQSFSTFAGNPYFIDLGRLVSEGLLSWEECDRCDFGEQEERVDYEKVHANRFPLLHMAYERFRSRREDGYDRFVKEQEFWLEDYCLYMAIKNQQGGKPWNEWEPALRDRQPEALEEAKRSCWEDIEFYRFQQYEFFKDVYKRQSISCRYYMGNL